MIITISGESCTGTTTLARNLSKALHIPCFLAGELFREIAKEHHIDLMTMVSERREELQLDQLLDDKILSLLRKPETVIVEGRLSGYLAWKYHIPSKRILLTANLDTKIQRLIEREGETVSSARQKLLTRDREDWEWYEKLYDITPANQNQWYSTIIKTDDKSIEQVQSLAQAHISTH